MLKIVLLLVLCAASNIDCADPSCTSCISGYLYNAASCLPLCPTAYIQSSSPNACSPLASLTIFNLFFYSTRNFEATSIGNFQHPLGLPFQDPSRGSPIPASERGFYFESTSRLVSNINYIMAPDFTLRMCIRIKADGTIFEVTSGGTSYFKLAAVSGVVVASWYLTSPSTSAVYSINVYTYGTGWACPIPYSSQQSGQFSMIKGSAITTIEGFEFRGQFSDTTMYFGGAASGGAFTGFLYNFWADNAVNTTIKLLGFINTCDYNQFHVTSSGACITCTGCSQTWPWCLRSSCSICYTDSCSSCNGYAYEDCTACNNGNTPPDCTLGKNCQSGNGVFDCTTCNSGYSLIDGLCLLEPYGYNPGALNTPVINMNFNTIQQYYDGIFQSGIDGTTWAPFNSPAADDPIPVKSRGLYFDGVAKYLVSTSNVVLNYKTTVAVWRYSQNGYYTVYTLYFTISTYRNAVILVSDTEDYISSYSLGYYFTSNQWIFEAYMINFVSNTVTLTYTDGSSVSNVYSIDGYAYYDIGSLMHIGRYGTVYFYKGFIYSIAIWQTVITDFSTEYDACGIGLGDSCIWSCSFNKYYNSYENACLTCDSSCTAGCSTWGTCALCQESDCGTCSNFNTTCTSTVPDPCIAGYVFSPGKKCCNSACLECYGPAYFNCFSCSPGSLLLAQVCVGSCPLGYAASNSNCLGSLSPFLNLVINVIQDQVLDTTQDIVFQTGVDTSFYPSGLPSDPVPSLQRGYYFTSTSYMSSGLLTLPYNFTMIFYIKQISGGALLSKSSFTINTLGSVAFSIISVISATFSAIPSTDWTVMAFSLWTVMDGTTTVSITYPQISYTSSITSLAVIYIDTSASLILGASSGSFVGFLYQFQVYLYPKAVSTLSVLMCTTSSESDCLINCDFAQYLFNSLCTACSASCTEGCVRASDCNLCTDRCTTCTGFTQSSCTGCISHATLTNGQCNCNAGWYWDGALCSACDSSCVLCTGPTSANCACWDNSSQVGMTCICNDRYYSVGNSCAPCHSSCLTCFGPTYYDCSSCENGLLEIVCLSVCPIGFNLFENKCLLTHDARPTVEFVFNTIQGVYYDEINNVGAMTGQSDSYYPNLDTTDPVPAYQRGLYFTGKCCYLSIPYPPELKLLFGIRAFISTWINPVSGDGTIFYKSVQDNIILCVSMQYLYLYLTVKVDNNHYSLASTVAFFGNEWNNLLISIDYSGTSSISVAVNTISTITSLGVAAPFVDIVGIPLIVGTTSLGTDCFQGFIYSIAIYFTRPSLSTLVSNSCDKCSICPAIGICMPSCNITTYSSTVSDCIQCNSTCTTGCRNSENCNLCDDSNCLTCTKYTNNSCTECKENFEIQNSTCVACSDSKYYNSTLMKCEACIGLCLSCTSLNFCTSCVGNSTLNLNYQCECNEGYSGIYSCTRNMFTAFITIDNQNLATITFTEPLLTKLTEYDLLVVIQNSTQSFELGYINDYTYVVRINFTQNIYSGDTINITFASQILSNLYSLLDITSLVTDLFAGSYSDLVSEINTLHNYAQIGLAIGLSTVLGTSAINVDPLSFFNFLNSAQIYSYVVLYQVNLDPALVSFLVQINAISQLPNPIAYIISTDQGVQLTGRMNDFGNNPNLLLLNSGVTLTIFALCILGKLGTYLLRLIRISWFKPIAEKIEEYFRYGVFSRLWIQSCLEIFINSLVGIFYTELGNNIQIFDFVLCWVMLVIFM